MKTAVVVGSGFGASVFAARLAASGSYRVHVLERGRQYGRNQFPRRPEDVRDAFWDPEDGKFGLFEYQRFAGAGVDVLTASGLGGGSLIYANVLYRMPPEFFAGWPGGITRARLDPYYDRVLGMLEARPYPADRGPETHTPKTSAFARAAEALAARPPGKPAVRHETPPLAITFGERAGEERPNRHGAMQTGCTRCGECCLGCNAQAKNTLDLNYLHVARRRGAVIETSAEVRAIVPRQGGGYTVVYGDPERPREARRLDCDRVVVGAGSLGTTRLLLRMKDEGHLPRLGDRLGEGWSPNGDHLGFCVGAREPIHPTTGPVITSAIRFFHGSFADGFRHGIWVEDAGIPIFVAWYLSGLLSESPGARLTRWKGLWQYVKGAFAGQGERNLGDDLGPLLFREGKLVDHVLPLLGMGRDRATGKLRLSGRRGADLQLDWQIGPSALHYERLVEAMQQISEALGGTFVESPLGVLGRTISVHPLGGCPMGDAPDRGVVSARTGEVFGHPGLFVADGSVIPTSIGPNPSLTITAVAEMFAARLVSQERRS